MLRLRAGKGQPERLIENEILDWLLANRIFSWPNKIAVQRGRKRFGHLKRTNGVPDILGIFKGKPLAIEVKTPIGRMSPEQIDFKLRFEIEGGIFIEARSLDDVKLILIV